FHGQGRAHGHGLLPDAAEPLADPALAQHAQHFLLDQSRPQQLLMNVQEFSIRKLLPVEGKLLFSMVSRNMAGPAWRAAAKVAAKCGGPCPRGPRVRRCGLSRLKGGNLLLRPDLRAVPNLRPLRPVLLRLAV